MSAGYCHSTAEALATGLVSDPPDLGALPATPGAEGITRTMAMIAARRRVDEIDVGIMVATPSMNSYASSRRPIASLSGLPARHHAEAHQEPRLHAGTAVRTTV